MGMLEIEILKLQDCIWPTSHHRLHKFIHDLQITTVKFACACPTPEITFAAADSKAAQSQILQTQLLESCNCSSVKFSQVLQTHCGRQKDTSKYSWPQIRSCLRPVYRGSFLKPSLSVPTSMTTGRTLVGEKPAAAT